MHSKKVVNKIDVDAGRPHKHYEYHHRGVGPKVTIRNIVTVDSHPYNKSSSIKPSESQDTDYDRSKFLVEERGRYWRNLKILYNDYTLVTLKQKELMKCEDNYVNQHCIEEITKLLMALKEKIQAKCKDIVFITNLCGDSEINPVVQSLADGEDIDRVLIKKQKKVNKIHQENKQKTKPTRKTAVKIEKKTKFVNKVSKVTTIPTLPLRRKSAVNEPKFFDSELHWCQICNIFPPTIKKYLQHLHDESHKKKVKDLRINESPWHKCLPEEQAWRTDTTDSVRVKAFNFFVPANGWFCQLCRSWMGDMHCAATHLRSYVHNMNLKNFEEKFPNWKQGWLDERSKALEKTFECRKENANQSQQNKTKDDKGKDEVGDSSGEEDPSEPISRHRTSKAKMWVPNQKAFERVCSETNPVTNIRESSSLLKVKVPKKDRPPFIGKMPLITSITKNKKIVMKELPPNTTKKIASSCAEMDEIEKQRDELLERIKKNEEEHELKLKEFIKVVTKIKKTSNRKKKSQSTPIISECYNATDYEPIVEPTDPAENLIGPPAFIAQWEADANYEYHMRQLQNYNMTSQMMQMPQPQTFLLDPYHAIALHNQQYYTNHMISNQYENFEIISRDDEQAYSQYIEFQNSPSSSPTSKMFNAGKSNPTSDDPTTVYTALEQGEERKKSCSRPTEKIFVQGSSQTQSPDETNPVSIKKRQLHSKDKKQTGDSKVMKRAAKPSPSKYIKKPPCLISDASASDVLPTFKETFLSDSSVPSSSYISSLLSNSADVKIVSSNILYKKRLVPGRRKRKKMKNEIGKSSKCTETPDKNGIESNEQKINVEEPRKQDAAEDQNSNHLLSVTDTEDKSKKNSPKKTEPVSLKDKIQSIRKQMDRSKTPQNVSSDEKSPKRARKNVPQDEECEAGKVSQEKNDDNTDENVREVKDRMSRRRIESEDSEEDEDDAKLIFYDMTSI